MHLSAELCKLTCLCDHKHCMNLVMASKAYNITYSWHNNYIFSIKFAHGKKKKKMSEKQNVQIKKNAA